MTPITPTCCRPPALSTTTSRYTIVGSLLSAYWEEPIAYSSTLSNIVCTPWEYLQRSLEDCLRS